MTRTMLYFLLIAVLAACNIAADPTNVATTLTARVDDTPPTNTPIVLGTALNPFGNNSDCVPVVTANGMLSDRFTSQSVITNTLPNGRSFPGVAPVVLNVSNQPIANSAMIQFTPTSTIAERNQYIASIGGTSREQIDSLHTYIVNLRPNMAISELPASPIVVRAEPEYIAGAAQAPNDPRYGEQWAFNVVGLPAAWLQVDMNRTVTVAVIDSGICASHPDLAGRITAGYDFIEDDANPQDEFGHGCGVAGVIAATANNGIGIAGIAPNVQIMPLRALDARGYGGYAGVSAAIVYAADNNADIINLSLAGPSYSQTLADAVAYAIQRGSIVIAAAGNFGSSATFYPAALPDVIAIGSVDNTMQRSSFSNYGANLDAYAPGRDILTTNLTGDYQMQTGTSFAAPIVSGLIAITHNFAPNTNRKESIQVLQPQNAFGECVAP